MKKIIKIGCDECLSRYGCQKNDPNCRIFSNHLFYDLEVDVPDILDKEEKEYLSAVIKPFRNRVINIAKERCRNQYYIIINMLDDDRMVFPYLLSKNMYKNMEALKKYDLEELGL